MVALTDVETVGLWAGILVGVASVVLAIVAIYFSIEVDRRSAATAAETIRSLERIESAVKAQSQDTRDLIKVGWERMLGNVGSPARPQAADEGIREVAAGLAAEIRAELGIGEVGDGAPDGEPGTQVPEGYVTTAEQGDRLEQALAQLRDTIETQLLATREGPADEVQFWLEKLSDLPESAQVVARAVSPSHITADQWRELRRTRVPGRGLLELRRRGILIPLEGVKRDGTDTLVYWFPPTASRAIRAAVLLLPEPDPGTLSYVQRRLAAVGYPDRPGAPEPSTSPDDVDAENGD